MWTVINEMKGCQAGPRGLIQIQSESFKDHSRPMQGRRRSCGRNVRERLMDLSGPQCWSEVLDARETAKQKSDW